MSNEAEELIVIAIVLASRGAYSVLLQYDDHGLWKSCVMVDKAIITVRTNLQTLVYMYMTMVLVENAAVFASIILNVYHT